MIRAMRQTLAAMNNSSIVAFFPPIAISQRFQRDIQSFVLIAKTVPRELEEEVRSASRRAVGVLLENPSLRPVSSISS